MNAAQKAIFPGLVVGILALFLITRWIAVPLDVAQAASGKDTAGAASAAPQPASQAVQTGECSLGSAFPESIRQWCSLIEQAAARYGLDANLIGAVMLMESGGDASAYSSSGAVGLLQVMPRDGLAAEFMCSSGQPCFASRPSMQELYDPAFNVDYGARMLSGLIEKRGSPREALYAYGPMDVGYSYADRVLAIQENYR
jgi:soluble lytic murein transglycosylase-like protein